MKPSVFVSGLILACSGLLAACGGNGINQPPFADVLTRPTPTPTPVPSFSQTAAAPMAAGTPVSFPSSNGFTGSVTVQAPGSNIPANTNLAVTITNNAPAGTPSLPNTLMYIGLQTNATVNVGAGAQVQTQIPRYFIPPSTPLAIDCFSAYENRWDLCVGPVDLPADNATTLTNFTVPFAFTLSANQTTWYALSIGSPSNVSVP